MDVEKRLLREAESFAEDLAYIDQEEFVAQVIKTLGISSDRVAGSQDASVAGRIQRPAPPGHVSVQE